VFLSVPILAQTLRKISSSLVDPQTGHIPLETEAPLGRICMDEAG
jgi:hypothetical protein